tara:strand:- start:4215 stop:6674 length:2460 start_codon:yes stop_codon:yes gene_type:complete
MRIPLYQSQVAPTSEAPGRPITTRYNANTAVQSELAKAKPMGTALTEIGEFARVRYEMARDNLLNEATLGADEKIFEAFNEMKESRDFNRVLDGENPLWNQRVEKIKTDLLKTLGKDRYSNDKFNAYFNQSELRHRFKLRGVIDTKVKQAQIEYSNMQAQNITNKHGRKDSNLADFNADMTMYRLSNDKRASYKAGFSSEQMNKVGKAVLYKTAEAALESYVFDSNHISFTSALEEVMEHVFPNAAENRPEGKPVNPYVVSLLNMVKKEFSPKEAAKMISGMARTTNFVESPTKMEIEEKELQKELAKAKIAEGTAKIEDWAGEVKEVGLYSQVDNEDLDALYKRGAGLQALANDIGNKDLINKADNAMSKIERMYRNKDIQANFEQQMPKERENFSDRFADKQKTQEGVDDFNTALKLQEEYIEDKNSNKDNIVGFSVETFGEAYEKSTGVKIPALTIEELLQPSNEETKTKIRNLKHFARWVNNNVEASENMQVLPRDLVDSILQSQLENNFNGDMVAMQNLYDNFASANLYDEVLIQLGKSPAFLPMGDLIRKNNTKVAGAIAKGVLRLKQSPESVPAELKNTQKFYDVLSEVFDLNDEVMLDTAMAYVLAAQGYSIAVSASNKIYDHYDSPGKKDLAIDSDVFTSINAVLGAGQDADGRQTGGIQNVFGNNMLVPDGMTSDQVEFYISNLQDVDMLNASESTGLHVDINTLKKIKGGGNFLIKPIASSLKNTYFMQEVEIDGTLSVVSLLDINNNITDIPAIFDFNTLSLAAKTKESPKRPDELPVVGSMTVQDLENLEIPDNLDNFESPSFLGN